MDESGRIYDELLVLHGQAGDRRALAELARRWHPRLLRSARRFSGDAELAREVAQDCWIGILRGLPNLRDPTLFPAWAFGILRRRCASTIGATVRQRERSPPLEGEEPAEPAHQGDRLSIERAFAELTPDHRIAATLYFVERLTLPEIAIATEVPLGTVKSRLFHARKSLKARLSGEDQ